MLKLFEIDIYDSSYSLYFSDGNIDMLSTEVSFTFERKVYYGTQLTMKCPH